MIVRDSLHLILHNTLNHQYMFVVGSLCTNPTVDVCKFEKGLSEQLRYALLCKLQAIITQDQPYKTA
jgi:hypothetical protein